MEDHVKAANNGKSRQQVADKVNNLAEEISKDNKAVAHILWGLCGAILLKRERLFSRTMKSWVEDKINDVHKRKEKRKRRRNKKNER